MVAQKYLNAAKNLEPVGQDENLSEFEQEVDSFFNYVLLSIKESIKEKHYDQIGRRIWEVTKNMSPNGKVVLRGDLKERYSSKVQRKEFLEVMNEVAKLYNEISIIDDYEVKASVRSFSWGVEIFYELKKN